MSTPNYVPAKPSKPGDVVEIRRTIDKNKELLVTTETIRDNNGQGNEYITQRSIITHPILKYVPADKDKRYITKIDANREHMGTRKFYSSRHKIDAVSEIQAVSNETIPYNIKRLGPPIQDEGASDSDVEVVNARDKKAVVIQKFTVIKEKAKQDYLRDLNEAREIYRDCDQEFNEIGDALKEQYDELLETIESEFTKKIMDTEATSRQHPKPPPPRKKKFSYAPVLETYIKPEDNKDQPTTPRKSPIFVHKDKKQIEVQERRELNESRKSKAAPTGAHFDALGEKVRKLKKLTASNYEREVLYAKQTLKCEELESMLEYLAQEYRSQIEYFESIMERYRRDLEETRRTSCSKCEYREMTDFLRNEYDEELTDALRCVQNEQKKVSRRFIVDTTKTAKYNPRTSRGAFPKPKPPGLFKMPKTRRPSLIPSMSSTILSPGRDPRHKLGAVVSPGSTSTFLQSASRLMQNQPRYTEPEPKPKFSLTNRGCRGPANKVSCTAAGCSRQSAGSDECVPIAVQRQQAKQQFLCLVEQAKKGCDVNDVAAVICGLKEDYKCQLNAIRVQEIKLDITSKYIMSIKKVQNELCDRPQEMEELLEFMENEYKSKITNLDLDTLGPPVDDCDPAQNFSMRIETAKPKNVKQKRLLALPEANLPSPSVLKNKGQILDDLEKASKKAQTNRALLTATGRSLGQDKNKDSRTIQETVLLNKQTARKKLMESALERARNFRKGKRYRPQLIPEMPATDAASVLRNEGADDIFHMMLLENRAVDMNKPPTSVMEIMIKTDAPRLDFVGNGFDGTGTEIVPIKIPTREMNALNMLPIEEIGTTLTTIRHEIPDNGAASEILKGTPPIKISTEKKEPSGDSSDALENKQQFVPVFLNSYTYESKFQTRGTGLPKWFPGFYTCGPHAESSTVYVRQSPSGVLLKAWDAMKPTYQEKEFVY